MTTQAWSVAGKRIVVVGAGRSGVAASDLLVARGANVSLADSQSVRPLEADRLEAAGVRLVLGAHGPRLFEGADLIVVSPGVPLTEPALALARRRGVSVIGEIELASRWIEGPIVAVTGTKGKSTTTTLTARMLAEGGRTVTAGGNLGTALSTQVGATSPGTVHVVEVSSFQLETTETFHPWIAVFVNLSADHLDRHATFDEYASAKARIFANQTTDDWAIVNADDPAVVELARRGRARRLLFGFGSDVSDGVTVDDGHIVLRRLGRAEPLVPLSAVHVPGRHLLADVMAATAVGVAAGVSPRAMTSAVRSFHGLEHALERVAEIHGVCFVNDSKATNVISALCAIESFDRGVVPILGGRYKGGDFEDLADALRSRADAIVVMGEAADRIAAALDGVVPIHRAVSMADAVRRAMVSAPVGGTVVLAPGCSSFDMFPDYRARGEAFKAAVADLGRELTGDSRPRGEVQG